MPYTVDELDNLGFYQDIARRDEDKYLKLIQKKIEAWDGGGILRDNSGTIILFENIVPGQGTDGTSYTKGDLHTLTWVRGYFEYEENEDLNKIIDREFTEL